ncbi:MAG TPA: hypothetical protein VJA94_13250 [Candidatus Angelobacter sp.]
MKTVSLLIAGLLLLSVTLAAAPAANSGNDAAAAFARLKTLAGEWEATTNMGKAHLSYQIISGGNAVVERESNEKTPEMLTVYYLDGDRLLLTHYCMAGNQPRMEAKAFDPQTGELRFQFLDATNLTNSKAGHMHNMTFHFVDNNHVSAEWQFFENGQQKFTESAQYTRVR